MVGDNESARRASQGRGRKAEDAARAGVAVNALRARELLENEHPAEAFASLKENYTAAWRASRSTSGGTREAVPRHQHCRQVRDHLAATVANGTLAQAELRELAQIAERRNGLGSFERCKSRAEVQAQLQGE
jgi:hypothetical protein